MVADTAASMRLPRRQVRAGIAIVVALLATAAAPSAFANEVPGAVTEETNAPAPITPPADVAPAPEADTTVPPTSGPPPADTESPVADTPAGPAPDAPVATPEPTAPTSPPAAQDDVKATDAPAADTTVTPLTTEGASGTGDAAPIAEPKASTGAGPVPSAPAPAPAPARETSQAPAEAARAEPAPASPAPAAPGAAVPVIGDWATTADGALASTFAPAGRTTVPLDTQLVFGVGSVSWRNAPAVPLTGSLAWFRPPWVGGGWTEPGLPTVGWTAAGWDGDVSWRDGSVLGPGAIGIERATATTAGAARGDGARGHANRRADAEATREIREVPLSPPREPANRVPAAAGSSAAGAGGGGGLTLVAALLAVVVLVAPGLGRRLALEVPRWRQPLFVASLERPG